MNGITLEQFFMGRDKQYAAQLTPEFRANAAETVLRANALLTLFFFLNPAAKARKVNSGWRPPAVNAATKGAAALSKHMTCQAVDLSDPDGELDAWLMTEAGQDALIDIGLWMEHPNATPRWAHVQTVPPRSGRRVFMP